MSCCQNLVLFPHLPPTCPVASQEPPVLLLGDDVPSASYPDVAYATDVAATAAATAGARGAGSAAESLCTAAADGGCFPGFCDAGDEPMFVFEESLLLPAQLRCAADLGQILRAPIIAMTAMGGHLAVTDGYSVYSFTSAKPNYADLRCRRSFRPLPRGFADLRINYIKLHSPDTMYATADLVQETTETQVGCVLSASLMGQVLNRKLYRDGQLHGFDFDQAGSVFLCYSGQRKAVSRIVKLTTDLRHLFHLDIDWDKIPRQICCCWDSNETWVSGQWGTDGGFLLSMRSDDPKGSGRVNSWLKPSAWRFERLLPNQLLSLGKGRLLAVNSANQEGSLYALYWTRRVPGMASQGWVPECQRVSHADNWGVTALCFDPEGDGSVLVTRNNQLHRLVFTNGGSGCVVS